MLGSILIPPVFIALMGFWYLSGIAGMLATGYWIYLLVKEIGKQ